VSKIKSPEQKKALSLAKDRRNTYGENSKASRKGIRRGKQRSHMEQRRAVGQILSQVRTETDDAQAIEADVLAKTELFRRECTAFKKTPDVPLDIVVKRKLARREKLAGPENRIVPSQWPNIYAADIFDVSYVRSLHKRPIMFRLRYRTGTKGWRGNMAATTFARKHQLEEAKRWREAILRNAPLLRGFFSEEPQWRDRMLRWCEKVLSNRDGR